MKIAMVGSGYVGLVSGACLADVGHEVVCIDKDAGKIERLENGIMPIYEPGLAELVARNVAEGRLSFTTDLPSALRGARAAFIAVGTPSRHGDGHADLVFVRAVAQEIGENITGDLVVVTKSTVPVGTGDEVARIIAAAEPAHRVSVVSNPEFLREGAAIGDFANPRPDRRSGSEDEFGREVMSELYRPFTDKGRAAADHEPPVFRAGEVCGQCVLATKITFINEMA
jgi:UDPglucose 6-dehydrogenase